MRFISTRSSRAVCGTCAAGGSRLTGDVNPLEQSVNFEHAVLDCMPRDGGLYVPFESPDLRRWILYTNENTSFASIAGTLTSACINDEFSPIICETIATRAFPFTPKLTKYTDRFFTLELCNTPTGSHKDFGVSYLVNCLETIFNLKGGNAVFLDATNGELGASLAVALRGKKHVKAVLLYPQGKVRGLSDADFSWNGGNILPLEVAGTESDCHRIVRNIFAQRSLVERFKLTVANTANIGRLMPQMFFYPYAFSRLKSHIHNDIYYAMAGGNYSNLVAGMYSWKLSLPVNGFICPATENLTVDALGQCTVPDSMVPFGERESADPASPSSLERLEDVFHNNSLMLKNLIFPVPVQNEETDAACKKLFMKYGILADKHTSQAYAAAMNNSALTAEDEAAVVLVVRDHPALSADYIRHTTGEVPVLPESVASALEPTELVRPKITTEADVIAALESLQ
ncbi:MAG: pyridoxal-phosphate dependent enzyme [Treponema sp.]|nr:pyridoxal-phosphate dependent enzyme [Treponema sp.]